MTAFEIERDNSDEKEKHQKPDSRSAEEKENQSKKKEGGTIWWKVLSFVCITLSILGGSFIGPSSNLLATDNAWIKLLWQLELRVLNCLPAFILEAIFTKGYFQKIKKAFKIKHIPMTLIMVVFELIWAYGLIFGA